MLASFFDPNTEQRDLFPPEYPVPSYGDDAVNEEVQPPEQPPEPEPEPLVIKATVEVEVNLRQKVDSPTLQRMIRLVSKRKRITYAEAEGQLANCDGLFADTYNCKDWH